MNKSVECAKEKDMNNMNKENNSNRENSVQNAVQITTKMQLPLTISNDQTEVFKEKEKSPTSVKDVKEIILSSSKIS